jgi:hypothetical protein
MTVTDYLDVTGHQPADSRPRRPTPCEDCASREVEKAPAIRHALALDVFSEEFNANPFPMIVCAGCGGERVDLCHGATLKMEFPMGWEVWEGRTWVIEIPPLPGDWSEP